uniref:HAT C-terminal dimerisation domain-containing protein n=1 Tax=Cajanus cajan TaxID=3821 RepID=A0A151QL26_CAJCA|nr:hypothetical protein KK1_049353 [Cajanus cajan]
MICSSKLLFNLAKNLYYVNSYSFAANHILNGFLPPGYNALRTTFSHQEKAQVERLLKPIKSTWNAKGISIVSDGWTDVQRRPLINFMIASERGPIFLKAINVYDEIKNKHYMADRMIENICVSKRNEVVYVDQCNWITQVVDDVKAQVAKEFILNDVLWDKILSTFYEVFYFILIDSVYRSNSLPPPPFGSSHSFLIAPIRIPPHVDEEIYVERNKCLKNLFHNYPKSWWVMHGSSIPFLQKLSLKLLVQSSSSSCYERNWSTYSFIHSLKRNKFNPKRVENLVYVHTNLQLLSTKSEEHM